MTSKLQTSPRVLLIDTNADCHQALQSRGYNVVSDTFGIAKTADPSGSWFPVDGIEHIPELAEQEIIFANLANFERAPYVAPHLNDGVPCVWTRRVNGLVDPRPIAMLHQSKIFKKVLDRGGMFVISVVPKEVRSYLLAPTSHNQPKTNDERVLVSNWSMLKLLDDIEVDESDGSQIVFENSELGNLLKKGSLGAKYSCTMRKPAGLNAEWWHPVAWNKYDEIVAAFVGKQKSGCAILLIPELPGLSLIACELLETWIANRSPQLFPDLQSSKWVHSPEYEVPEVIQLQAEAQTVLKVANDKSEAIGQQILEIQSRNQNWYELLRGTDSSLVKAVVATLASFGFKSVTDMDAAFPDQTNKSEDIQVADRDPVLVIDVKGLTGTGTDEDVRQAQKHASIRNMDPGPTRYKPLAILNTQRNLPPRDRNPNPFREEIIKDAVQTRQGVMTTWDLFNIARNKQKWKWPDSAVQDIFYQSGRIDPVPSHYDRAGKVVLEFKGGFGVIPERDIRVGDTLVLRREHQFEEFVAKSLMVDNKPTDIGAKGSNVGVVGTLKELKAKIGMDVYKVK